MTCVTVMDAIRLLAGTTSLSGETVPPPPLMKALDHWSLTWCPTHVPPNDGRYDAVHVSGFPGATPSITLATVHPDRTPALVRAVHHIRAVVPFTVDAVALHVEPAGVRLVTVPCEHA